MRRFVLVLVCVLLMPLRVSACLWDSDTLRDERRGLPGIAEILAGKYERHSKFFYQDRIEKIQAVIEKDPNNLPAYDNLAVAYEKLDDQDNAIRVMLEKEKISPNQYTTYANLGTFYLHKGDFENGITYIEKALTINPQAHFGREEYQLKLAKFLQAGKSDPELLKTQNFLGIEVTEIHRVNNGGQNRTHDLTQLGLKSNVMDGIVGMIRFGTGKSAELYCVLGDLLAYQGHKHLAYRAFLRAQELKHPREEYVQQAMKDVMGMVEDHGEFAPELIASERDEAERWVKAYQDYEDNLVRDGANLDDPTVYASFYQQHGPPTLSSRSLVAEQYAWFRGRPAVAGLVALLIIVCVAIVIRDRRRKSKAVQRQLL